MARRKLTLHDIRPEDPDRDVQPARERRPRRWSRFFPAVLWLALVAFGIAAAYAAWRAVAAGGDGLSVFAQALVWPGSAIFAVVFVVAFAGWTLDID